MSVDDVEITLMWWKKNRRHYDGSNYNSYPSSAL